MNTLLRSLLVWLLMLALPYQGMAAAAMVACAPLPAPAQAITAHAGHDAVRPPCHEQAAVAGSATQEWEPEPEPEPEPEQQAGGLHAGAAKCAYCAACGIAAVLPAGFPPLASALPPSLSAPRAEGTLPTVHLDQPERPPRFFLA